MIFLGCDAGSTKTDILLVDSQGSILAHEISEPCNYMMVGQKAFGDLMQKKIEHILKAAGVSFSMVTYSVYGFPAYGEKKEMEHGVPEALGEFASPMHSLIVNDAVIAFAGSFGGQPGIHVVAGTGSSVYGENSKGKSARVGGWSLLFDDEGSCAWIGRMTLSLFFKQADGRLAEGPLLEVFRKHYGLRENLLYFVGDNIQTLSNDRAALARVQMLTAEAAEQGDENAKQLYHQAIEKLIDMVDVASSKLTGESMDKLPVSYSGGLFKNGDLVLTQFRKLLQERGYNLIEPQFEPVLGAIAMGAKQYLDAFTVSRMLKKLQNELEIS